MSKRKKLMPVHRSVVSFTMTTDLRILHDLAHVPKGSNCALIIRHGDRDAMLNKVVTYHKIVLKLNLRSFERDSRVGLNQQGVERSLELGRSLKGFSELRSWSSPIGRCVDTCKRVSEGFGTSNGVESTHFLGMQPPFMVQPAKAYELMVDLGLDGFVEAYINDRIDPSIALPCPEGTRMLFSYAIERIGGMKGGIGLFVTHDMILTPALAYYYGYDFKGKGLVQFLDGFVLYETEEGFTARFCGQEMKVSKNGRPLGSRRP